MRKHTIMECRGRCILENMREEIGTLISADSEESRKKRNPGRPEKVSPNRRIPRLLGIERLILDELYVLDQDESRRHKASLKNEAARAQALPVATPVKPTSPSRKKTLTFDEAVAVVAGKAANAMQKKRRTLRSEAVARPVPLKSTAIVRVIDPIERGEA